MLGALLALPSLCAQGCDAGASGDAGAAPSELAARGLLVVSGDYQSTTLSRVDVDGLRVEAAAFLHSGSAIGPTGAALSGDVVAGRVLDGSGDALVVDRGRGAITRLSGLGVRWQRGVSVGFAANPQDALALPGLVVVVRGQSDPKRGGAGAGDDLLAGGDDLVGLDVDGQPRWRLPLADAASLPDAYAMGGSPARRGGRLWLPLASVAKAFDTVGPGRLVAVDATPAGAGVVATIALDPLANCRSARLLPAATAAERSPAGPAALAVVCSGSFAASPAAQLASSGVAFVAGTDSDAGGDAGAAAVARVVPASRFDARPLGFALAVDATSAYVVSLGDLEADVADALWRVGLQDDTVVRVATGSGAFKLGGLWHDDVAGRLWLCDSGLVNGAEKGDLRLFRTTSAEVVFERALMSNPKGLRALEIAPW